MSSEISPVAAELGRQLAAGPIDLKQIWIAAGRPRGRSPVMWAKRIGLDDDASRDTARDYARYLDERLAPGRLGMRDLKPRGWTEAMVRRLLGEPDALACNPHSQKAAPMRLYSTSRVEAAEASAEFAAARAEAEKRGTKSRAAAERRMEQLLDAVEAIEIDVPELDPDELVRRACDAYNEYQRGLGRDGDAGPDSDPQFLERICVNYLRHRMTDYDSHLYDIKGKVGTRDAYEEIRYKVFGAIADRYPWLGDECSRQEKREREGW